MKWSVSAVTMQIIFSIFGIFLNIMLLYAHKKDPCKRLRSSSSPFIVNIAFIDFLASCCNLAQPFLSDFSFYSPTYTLRKRLIYAIIIFLVSISFTSFASLSVERFFSVAFPLWHRVRITNQFSRYWLMAVWFFHFIYDGSITIILLYNHYETEWILCKCFSMLAMFLLTQIMYLASYISLRKQRKGLYKREDSNENNIRMIEIRLQNEKNFLITIAIVCFVLVVTVLPGLIILFITILFSKNSITFSSMIKPQTVWGMAIMTSNYAVNGLIYLWRMKKYRKTFKELYCKCL